MKKFLSALILFLLTAGTSFAADTAILDWLPNSEVDLAGYKVYQSTVAGTYTTPVVTLGKVITSTLTLPTLTVDQRYYFTITAYNTAGQESGKSNEVSKLIVATLPKVTIAPLALNIAIPAGASSAPGSIVSTNTGLVPVTLTWNDTNSCLSGLTPLVRTLAVGASTTWTINGTCATAGTVATLMAPGLATINIPITITKASVPPAAPAGVTVR